MGDSTQSLRRKISSAGELRSVVRTMKSLAASSIGQFERSTRALADYHRTVALGLGACLRAAEPSSVTATRGGQAQVGVVGAVVFGSDQGLVGQFNEVVAEHATQALGSLPGKLRIWAVGVRVHARLADAGAPLAGLFPVPSSVEGITPLVGRILVESGESGSQVQVAELHLFYNRPRSGAGYTPVGQRLLPLDETWRRGLTGDPWPTRNLPQVLGGGAATLRALVREYLFISIFRACAESLAAENASRLAAMERADKNIDQLIEGLDGRFRRLRQSGIDEELSDVVSGYEALGGAGPPRAGRDDRPS